MAAYGSFHAIFENPRQDKTPKSFLETLSSSSHWNPTKGIPHVTDHHETPLFTEIFGELHFREPVHSSYEKTSTENNSLQLCTEGLGAESYYDLEDEKVNANLKGYKGEEEDEIDVKGTKDNGVRSNEEEECGVGKKERIREYPPAMTRMSFKTYREEGRLVLEEVRIPRREFLRASREDGRLRLKLVQPEDEEDDEEEEEEEEEMELNLGLSLGGRFGVDKSNKLVRSSSVVVTMPLFREDHNQPEKPSPDISAAAATTMKRHTGLTRTTSLPAESEEERRKRKETQTLRRMAAKRRRSEKLRSGGGNHNTNPDETATTSRRRGRPSSGLPRWSATAYKTGLLRQHSTVLDSQQGSVESQGGGGGVGSSTSVSELETKSHQASSEEARSLQSTQHQEATTKPINRLRRLSSVDMKIEPQGKGKSEMPCVFTKGDGPNGKRVDGILYRYGNGEEVRIMCVCHGDFLSPADFVKHAGGPHVDHPLRHIVVNTSSPSNLL